MTVLASRSSVEEPRPDVLGYPSPTTSRYLIFAAALVASGLFVGNYVHNWVFGDAWRATVATCFEEYGTGGTILAMIDENRQFTACTAETERTRVAVTVAGALVAALSAAVMLWVAPVVVRRRRGLKDLPDALVAVRERFAELAQQAGVRSRVAPVLGATGQRDAFSFGAPGRYCVVLPPAVAVRWRDGATFDPLVRHELAHVRHRDVALAWLTRLVWWALVPLLLVPVVAAMVTGDLSILGGYLWRAALLALVVALLSSSLLRSREYGADLRAARLQGDPAAVVALLRRAAHDPARSGWRRVLANHPTTAERVAVLERPALVTRNGFVDGVTSAFLAALAVPLIVATTTPLLAQAGRADLAYAVAAGLLGPMVAGSVGLGIWRATLFSRVTGLRVHHLPVAAGVAVGLVLGQVVSLQQSGIGAFAGVSHPAWLIVTALAGAGAVVVSAGLGHLWADAAPTLPGVRTAWVIGLVLNSVLFSAVLWSSTLFQDAGDWELARLVVTSTLAPWPMFWLVLLLAAAAALAMLLAERREAVTPSWLVEGDARPPWRRAGGRGFGHTLAIALAAGLAGGLVIATYRWSAGPAVSDEATWVRFLTYQWVAAVAAGGSALVLMLPRHERGPGSALLAGPVAALGVLTGFLVLNTALGGTNDGQLVTEFARPAVVLGFYLTVLLAPLSAVIAHGSPSAVPPAAISTGPTVQNAPAVALALGAVLVLVGGAGAGAITARTLLVGSEELQAQLLGEAGAVKVPSSPAAGEDGSEAASYLAEIAPAVLRRYSAAAGRGSAILGDITLTGPKQAALLEAEVLPPLEALLADMEQVEPHDRNVAALHAEALAALKAAVESYRILVESRGFPTSEDFQRVQELQVAEARHWSAWLTRQQKLAAG